MSAYEGTTWNAKDGSRQIQISHELSEWRGERQFLASNTATGRRITITLSGLDRKYDEYVPGMETPDA